MVARLGKGKVGIYIWHLEKRRLFGRERQKSRVRRGVSGSGMAWREGKRYVCMYVGGGREVRF